MAPFYLQCPCGHGGQLWCPIYFYFLNDYICDSCYFFLRGLAQALEPGLSVQEVLDILHGDGRPTRPTPQAEAVFIAPPEPAVLTDEDSGDEDGGGVPDNLNPR